MFWPLLLQYRYCFRDTLINDSQRRLTFLIEKVKQNTDPYIWNKLPAHCRSASLTSFKLEDFSFYHSLPLNQIIINILHCNFNYCILYRSYSYLVCLLHYLQLFCEGFEIHLVVILYCECVALFLNASNVFCNAFRIVLC